MKRLLIILILALPATALADGIGAYHEKSVFDCGNAKDIQAIDACAEKNTEQLRNQKAPAFQYSPDAAKYFYNGLVELARQKIYFDEKSTEFTLEQELFRRHLNEWLYFSTPAFASDDNKPPQDFGDFQSDGMMAVKVYRQGNDFIVFYWAFLAASNSASQAVRLHHNEDGSVQLIQLRMENFEEKGKPLSISNASFNDFTYNEATAALGSSGRGSAVSVSTEEYQLKGDLFHLQKETEYNTDTEHETILYKLKK